MAAEASRGLAPCSLAGASSAWSPALSPDGAVLAFLSDRTGAPELMLLDRNSGEERAVPSAPAGTRQVQWSVDGEWLSLLVAPQGSPRTQVWVLRPDGSALRALPGVAGGASFLGPWTHEPGVLAVAHTTEQPGEGIARLECARGGEPRLIASGGQPLVLDL
ncbi:MAG: hypothetical protein RL033_6857, partial [Pseudomonadota bacterium]